MAKEQLQRVGDESTCCVAVMMRDGQILTGHRHYTKDKWKDISVWTIPGGRCDPGETVEQALRREIFEEVGIDDFNIEDFIGEVPGAKEGDQVLMFYCSTNQDAKLMEPEKFSEWRWISQDVYMTDQEYTGFNPTAREVITDFLMNKKAR